MAFLATLPAWVPIAFSAASTIIGVVGQISAGQSQADAARAQAEYQSSALRYQAKLATRQAQQMEQEAGQERAVSQRAAMEERRRGRFVSSEAQAIAAASGAGALDPTIVNILGDIGAEEETRALTALYMGEERARGLEYGAKLTRAGGRGDIYAAQRALQAGGIEASAAKRASYFGAAGTLLEGGSSLFSKYAEAYPQEDELTSSARYGFVPWGGGHYRYG